MVKIDEINIKTNHALPWGRIIFTNLSRMFDNETYAQYIKRQYEEGRIYIGDLADGKESKTSEENR